MTLSDLAPGDVHVWRIELDVPERSRTRFEATLDASERARADRFRTEALRASFVAGRGALRAILGACLVIDPASVSFVHGPKGKPALAEPAGTGLEFNLAHSGGRALCALTLGRPVGVDVERVRPMSDAGRIIARYFTEREQAEFLAHEEEHRPEAFFRGWTRKEAFLKATGEGLAAGLDSFEVALEARAEPILIRVGDDPLAARRWTLRDVEAGPGYLGAVAVEGPLARLSVGDWPQRPPLRGREWQWNRYLE